MLQLPHHPAYVTPPFTASAVIEWPAPVSWTFFQLQGPGGVAAGWQTVAHAAVSFQTYSPPATQCFGLLTSVASGAMKRGVGSHLVGSNGPMTLKHDGEMVRYVCPPSVVRYGFKSTYSPTMSIALDGLTMTSPPSPPAGVMLWPEPGRSSEVPLSCRATPVRRPRQPCRRRRRSTAGYGSCRSDRSSGRRRPSRGPSRCRRRWRCTPCWSAPVLVRVGGRRAGGRTQARP